MKSGCAVFPRSAAVGRFEVDVGFGVLLLSSDINSGVGGRGVISDSF